MFLKGLFCGVVIGVLLVLLAFIVFPDDYEP